MSDDTSGPRNTLDPLEDYMASFFCSPMSEPLKDLVNTSLNKPDDSTTLAATGLSFKKAKEHSNKPAMTNAIAIEQSQYSLLPKFKKPINPANSHSKHVFGHKAYVAEQLPRDMLLDTHQKQNLQKLLDETLNQPLFDAVQSPEVITLDAKQHLTLSQSLPIKEPEPEPEPEPEQEHEQEQEQEHEHEHEHEPGLEPEPVLAQPSTQLVDYRSHWQNNKPPWAQNTFDALLFKCRGVTLAIPLASLGHIYLHNEPLKKLPNLPAWVLGVKPMPQGSLKIIDAGQYFLPERSLSLNVDGELYILAIADCLWGFAVDSLSNPIRVKLDDVQWRPLNGYNPWLAGTIKKQMCVLIDTPALLAFLNTPSI